MNRKQSVERGSARGAQQSWTRTSPAPLGGARIDGRALRASRTREAIADAMVAMVREGNLRPTGEQIATRAGVSLRAFRSHFKSQESLIRATNEEYLRVMAENAEHTAAPSADPVHALVEERARGLEATETMRQAAALAGSSKAVAEIAQRVRKARRRQCETTFAGALAAVEGEEQATLVAALDVMLSAAVWDELRRGMRLSRRSAGHVVEHVLRMLTAPPPARRAPRE